MKLGVPIFLVTRGITVSSTMRERLQFGFIEYDKFERGFRTQCDEIPFHDPRSRQAFAEYQQAIEREPPVVERVELIDRPQCCVDAVREAGLA